MATLLEAKRSMMRGKLITGATTLLLVVGLTSARADVQQPAQPPTGDQQAAASFKSGVDVVRVAAVVRDRKGRFVQDLKARDFEVLDEGRTRSISDLQSDVAAISIAVLFDVSGSME